MCISPEALEAIREAYVACVGFMTASIAHEIEAAIKDGMFPEVVIDAIQQTGNAPRPSPYYLRTILRRWRPRGATTSGLWREWRRHGPTLRRRLPGP